MNSNDRHLGMDRAISRRDFVNGTAMAAGTLVVPKWVYALDQELAPEKAADYYPPTRTGMRAYPFLTKKPTVSFTAVSEPS